MPIVPSVIAVAASIPTVILFKEIFIKASMNSQISRAGIITVRLNQIAQGSGNSGV
jgi:hypothetical protein